VARLQSSRTTSRKNASACASRKCRKQDWLRVLHVRHAGHGNAKPALRLADERSNQLRDSGGAFVRGLFHEHAEVGGHQFIAAAARVQFVAQRPKKFDERGFNEMVHVLSRRRVKPCRIAPRAPAILSSAVRVSRISSTVRMPADFSAPAHTRSTASS